MDTQKLIGLLRATMDPNERKTAEEQLTQVGERCIWSWKTLSRQKDMWSDECVSCIWHCANRVSRCRHLRLCPKYISVHGIVLGTTASGKDTPFMTSPGFNRKDTFDTNCFQIPIHRLYIFICTTLKVFIVYR